MAYDFLDLHVADQISLSDEHVALKKAVRSSPPR